MADTAQAQSTLRIDSLTGIHWVGVVAALVTAAVHLLLGVRMLPSPMGISFVLAGLGFLGAIGLVLVDYRRRTVSAVGIPFTLVQIVLWYIVNFTGGPKSFPADVGTLGAVDKVAQVVLLVVLVVLLR
jgi:succinate dehydrogenase/fumarate reductase cytochrome b subunit